MFWYFLLSFFLLSFAYLVECADYSFVLRQVRVQDLSAVGIEGVPCRTGGRVVEAVRKGFVVDELRLDVSGRRCGRQQDWASKPEG